MTENSLKILGSYKIHYDMEDNCDTVVSGYTEPNLSVLILGCICMSSTFRSVHVSRKFWHMLVNLCFHISLTCGVFVGGINQIRYASVCQAVSTHHLHTSRIPAASALAHPDLIVSSQK